MPDRRIVVLLVFGFTIGCNKDERDKPDGGSAIPLSTKPAGDGGAADDGGGEATPTVSRGETLIPPVQYAPLGEQPGYVGDGLLYVALRARQAHDWVKTLPMPDELVRDAREFKGEHGFDPLADDWLTYFSVPSDAVLSATILRPIDDGIGPARMALAEAGEAARKEHGDVDEWGAIREFRKEDFKAEERAEEKAEPIAWAPETKEDDKAEARQEAKVEEAVPVDPADPLAGLGEELPEAPPPLPLPAEFSGLRQMAFHTRIHVPSTDPAATSRAMLALFETRQKERGLEACGTLKVSFCVAHSREVIVVREVDKAVTIEFIAMLDRSDTPGDWAPVIRKAMDAGTAKIPNAAAMGGHAAMWIDPAMLSRVAALDKMGSVLSSIQWARDPADFQQDLMYSAERLERIDSLVAAPRMFTGVRIEAVAEGDALQGRATWPLAEQGMVGRIGASLISARRSETDVPKIEALCEGSLMCFRTQRLPDARPLRKRLATEGFGGRTEDVFDRLDRDEEYTFTLLLAGGWANLLASTMGLSESLTGMEATVAKTVLDATMRGHGFGGTLQSIRETGFIRFDARYALYGLAEKPDVDAAAGLLSLVGMSPTTLELGELGTAQALDTRSEGPHAHAIFHGPAKAADDDEDAAKVPGWIALVDDPDRYKWLRGRETEKDAGPAGYFAIPDLWALITSFDPSPREFMFADAWLRGRKLAFVLDPAEDGAPRMRARLSKP